MWAGYKKNSLIKKFELRRPEGFLFCDGQNFWDDLVSSCAVDKREATENYQKTAKGTNIKVNLCTCKYSQISSSHVCLCTQHIQMNTSLSLWLAVISSDATWAENMLTKLLQRSDWPLLDNCTCSRMSGQWPFRGGAYPGAVLEFFSLGVKAGTDWARVAHWNYIFFYALCLRW